MSKVYKIGDVCFELHDLIQTDGVNYSNRIGAVVSPRMNKTIADLIKALDENCLASKESPICITNQYAQINDLLEIKFTKINGDVQESIVTLQGFVKIPPGKTMSDIIHSILDKTHVLIKEK